MPQRLYIYREPDSYEPLACIDGQNTDQVFYYQNDVSGLPEELTDASGEVVWEAQYEVWGNTVREHWAQTQRIPQNLRFQGQYLDRETGLHYNTFRYFDPDIGRFTQPDPIGLNGGLNLYQYAPYPISWIDPWGLNKADWKLFGADGKLMDEGKGWRPDPKARDIPGRTGDTEQKILRHVEDVHGAKLKNSTLVIESQDSFRPIGKGKWAPVKGGMEPCPFCRAEMGKFANRYGMDVHYEYKGKTESFKGRCRS